MTLIRQEVLTVSEVLCHLSATTNAPSSMGAQLEQLAAASDARTHGAGWTTKAKAPLPKRQDPESNTLRDASMHRLVTGLGDISGGLDPATAETLIKVAYDRKQSVGRVIVQTLRAFHAALQALTDEEIERACLRADKSGTRRPGKIGDSGNWVGMKACANGENCTCQHCQWERSYERACIEYRSPRGQEAVQELYKLKTSQEAAMLYGDCLIVLAVYVQQFNRKAVG